MAIGTARQRLVFFAVCLAASFTSAVSPEGQSQAIRLALTGQAMIRYDTAAITLTGRR
jgi:hypothetical protein